MRINVSSKTTRFSLILKNIALMELAEQAERIQKLSKRNYDGVRVQNDGFKQGFFQEEAKFMATRLPTPRVSFASDSSSSAASTFAPINNQGQRFVAMAARPASASGFALPPTPPMRKFFKKNLF